MVNIGLPHDKRAAFIKSLSPHKPLSRLNSGIAILLPGESYDERKYVLMNSLKQSRQYIRVMQWNADKLPEVKQEIYDIIKHEQAQMRATFDELVALKRHIQERIKDAETNGLSN